MILLLLLAVTTVPLSVGTSSPNESNGTSSTLQGACTQTVIEQINSMHAAIDQAKAVSTAEESSSFASILASYSSNFYGISPTWSWDSSCVVTLKSVEVIFTVVSPSGSAAYAVASEDPSLGQVVTVGIQNNTERYGNIWSGYQFYGSATQNVAVYGVAAYWSVPTASQPYSGACPNAYCDVAVWVGLTNDYGGANGIVQTGTDSIVGCNSLPCTTTGWAWWQFYPGGPYYCAWHPNTGDSITADAVSEITTGGPATTYDVLLIDNTKNLSCSTTQSFAQMGTPYYGEFMAEQAQPTLAKFTTFSINQYGSGIYYNGAWRSITVPYSNYWYNAYVISGSCGQETSLSSVNSAGDFNEQWLKSC